MIKATYFRYLITGSMIGITGPSLGILNDGFKILDSSAYTSIKWCVSMGAWGVMTPMNFLRDAFGTHEILKSMYYVTHEIFESLYTGTLVLKLPTHPLSSHPKCNAPRPAAALSLKGHVLYKRSYYH